MPTVSLAYFYFWDMVQPPTFGRTYISFDWVLERLLRNRANLILLEGFLNELFKQNIRVENLL